MPRAAPLVLALCLAALSPSGGTAFADDVEALRAGLIDGSVATWPAQMATLARSAEQIGAVVGPMLRERAEAHRAVAAYAASWLADHPVAGRVLLAEEIVRRGGADPEFVRELRSALTRESDGWARLVAVASGLAKGPASDAELAALGVGFLRHEATASNVRDLLDVWEHAGRPALAAAAKQSFESVLGASFDDVAAARRFLDAQRGRTLLEWVRELSIAKDRPDAPRFARLLVEARANLERVTTPEGLRAYLLPGSTPWPEVRRLAALRAKSIDPTAEGWGVLFAESVDEEPDFETLDALLNSFDGIRSFDASSATHLAESAARRLQATPAPADGLAIGLLAVLGRLGTSELLRGAATTLVARGASATVLVAWLEAAASVRGLSPEIRALHLSRRQMPDEGAATIRIRALGALARGGAETPEEAAANGSYLAELLTPRWKGSTQPEGPPLDGTRSAEERAAAARGLEAFPVRASVEALAARATDASEDVALARLAASVLGRMAAKEARAAGGGTAALDALIEVARTSGVPIARVSAIEDLGRLAADGIAEPKSALEVFRSALDPTGPLDLRRAAARASAAALDPLSVPLVFALVAEEATLVTDAAPAADSASTAAERLVRGLSSADATSDGDLARALRALLDTGPAGAAAAFTLAAAAADEGGGRAALQETRARLLLRRARAVGRAPTERLQDLDAAHRILDALLVGAIESIPFVPVPVSVGALDREIVAESLHVRLALWRARATQPAADERADLLFHRGLAETLRAAHATGFTSAAILAAEELETTLLARLRDATAPDVRLGALIDSARIELRAPRGVPATDRARGYLAAAKALEPGAAERAEIDRLEAESSSDGAPPPPK